MDGKRVISGDYRNSLYYAANPRDRVGIDELNGFAAVNLYYSSVSSKAKALMEEAKDLYEAEQDEASLGEYMALKKVVLILDECAKQLLRHEFYQEDIQRLEEEARKQLGTPTAYPYYNQRF